MNTSTLPKPFIVKGDLKLSKKEPDIRTQKIADFFHKSVVKHSDGSMSVKPIYENK